MDGNRMREADLDNFRNFVVAARWRFAKTYVESYPHEYVLQPWLMVKHSLELSGPLSSGASWSFWKAERRYLYVDGRKYWHMGNATSDNPAERPTLINRTWLNVSRYRENAKTLGYDDATLDMLAMRWTALLERARRETNVRR